MRAETILSEKMKLSRLVGISLNSNIGSETAKSLPECKVVSAIGGSAAYDHTGNSVAR